MTVLDVGAEFINVDGNMVEKDVLHIAEQVKKLDENLTILCVNPALADFNEAPFIIAERCPDGVLRRVFECWQLDQTVLERIEAADTTRNDIQAYIEHQNAVRLNKSRSRYQEKKLEIADIATSLLKTKKSSFTYKDPNNGDSVTIYEDRPAVRK